MSYLELVNAGLVGFFDNTNYGPVSPQYAQPIPPICANQAEQHRILLEWAAWNQREWEKTLPDRYKRFCDELEAVLARREARRKRA